MLSSHRNGMMGSIHYRSSTLLVSLLLACGGGEPAPSPAIGGPVSDPGAANTAPVILFIGTSLTAGYGLDPAEAYPALIQARLDSVGLRYRAVNAGVSGETSAGALRRVEWLFAQESPAVVILETGGNDGLRGQDPDSLGANIAAILGAARGLDPSPILVLAGMEAPPNLGERYTRRFREVFPEAAEKTGATLIPFLLEGVAGVQSLNQADGIHPTAEGQAVVAGTVWRVLGPLLAARAREREGPGR
ncbi:MAG: arylesterase [Gemmatimonadota bacterium]